MHTEPPPVPLVRNFLPIPDTLDPAGEQVDLSIFGVSSAVTWNELDEQFRVVILADAGAGKTHEMKGRAAYLRGAGRYSFFLRIEDLNDGVSQAFEIGTTEEYRRWRNSSDDAWFFLDSVDEAKLDSPRAFEKAVCRFAAEIHGAKHRAHVILSSRPYAWAAKSDRALVEEVLPCAAPATASVSVAAEPDTEMSTPRNGEEDSSTWRIYKLAPLRADDVRDFAKARNVPEIAALLVAIARADLWSMAERPFDLGDIFERWVPGEPLGSRLDILQHGIRKRLREIDETRSDRQPLNLEQALAGARRLAAAVVLTKQAGIRIPDGLRNELGVDASAVLAEWQAPNVKALLGRAVFNDAIYGAVRFRHREVRELLAAEWLHERIQTGERRAVEALIFREQYGELVIVPTLRPVLPWLILFDAPIRARALGLSPEIAAEGGDTARLPLTERRLLLTQIVERIGTESEDRAAHHNEGIARIAQHDLAEEAYALIEKHAASDDAIFFLGRFVWQGELHNCTPLLLPIAISSGRGIYARIAAARAVLTVGSADERIELWSGLLTGDAKLDRRLLAELLSADTIDDDIVPKLMIALDRLPPRERFEATGLRQTLHALVDRLSHAQLTDLVHGLDEFLGREPHIERAECAVSQANAWLLGTALHAVERLVGARSVRAFDSAVFSILTKVPAVRHWSETEDDYKTKLAELVPAWPEFNDQLYWTDVARARAAKALTGERVTDDWPAAWVGPFWKFDEIAFDRLIGYVAERPLLDDRLVALTRAFITYREAGRPRRWRDRLHASTHGEEELSAALARLMRPPPSELHRKWAKQSRDMKRRRKMRDQRTAQNRRRFVNRLKANPDIVRHPPGLKAGEFSNDQHWLMGIVEGEGLRTNRTQGADWQELIKEFGIDVATAYRDAAIAHWRHYVPVIRSQGGNTGSTPYSLIFAMAGMEIERRETPDFPNSWTENEARHALLYAGWELNGFPRWLEPVFQAFPKIAFDAIWTEIAWELENSPAEAPLHYMLHDIVYYAPWMHAIIAPKLLEWLRSNDAPNVDVQRHSLHILISGGTSANDIEALSRARIPTAPQDQVAAWFTAWVDGAPATGIPALAAWLDSFSDANEGSRNAQIFVASLQGGRGRSTDPKLGAFRTAEFLKELYVLMHRYIRSEDDIERAGKGVYSPQLRDDAQDGRNHLFNQLAEIPGKATYTMLLQLAEDHPAEKYRSWMGIRARQRAISDADLEPWTAEQVYEFSSEAERTPSTPRQLFELACARLLDCKDWLERGNDSPAETYRRVERETEMRNLVAGWLNQQARSRYTTAQEPEYANAQRSDFWIQAPGVATAVPIELKLVDKGWSGPDLCERLRNQLIGDYLRERRATEGIMLLVWQGREPDRRWQIGDQRVPFADLASALRRYWDSIAPRYPQVNSIEIIGVDLTLRAEQSSS